MKEKTEIDKLKGFETSLKAVEERYGLIKVVWGSELGAPIEQLGLMSAAYIERMVRK